MDYEQDPGWVYLRQSQEQVTNLVCMYFFVKHNSNSIAEAV